jgi:hypothetical protein
MLEVISIHIPKTAGQSFKRVLQSVYGSQNVLHTNNMHGYFKIIGAHNSLMRSDTLYRLSEGYTVLHGHFTYNDIRFLHNKYNPIVFSWVRHPVERVISYYNYALRKTLIEHRFMRGFEEETTLLDFARRKNARNVMTKYLEGIDLEEIDFLGVFEYLREDMQQLAEKMGWGQITLDHKNSSEIIRKKRPPVPEEEKRIIRDLNEKDMALYEQALILREKRIKEGNKKIVHIPEKISSSRQKTEDRVPIEPAMIFLHIPKTGGMTLYEIIKDNIPEDETFTIPANGEDLFKELSPEERERYRCIMGHAMFGIHEYISRPFYYLTFIRNPADRLRSQYYHALGASGGGISRTIREGGMSFEDFVRSDMNVLYNYQTRMIAGKAAIKSLHKKYKGRFRDKIVRFTAPELLVKAKRNINVFFRVVGVVERYDESLIVLSKKIGLKNIFYRKVNVTKSKPEARQISEDIRDIILEKNKLDMKLYEFANRLLDQEIKSYGINFYKDLKTFKLHNRVRGVLYLFRDKLRIVSGG